jgi:hypothetical protein
MIHSSIIIQGNIFIGNIAYSLTVDIINCILPKLMFVASLKTAFFDLSLFMGTTGTDLNGVNIKNEFFSFLKLISVSLSQSEPYKNLKQKVTFMKCCTFKWGRKLRKALGPNLRA